MMKIADTPCHLIFFELYSKEPDEMWVGFIYGSKSKNKKQ
jgi:hypothetical protein